MVSAKEHRLSAVDMANQQNRLVILGDPGSGKSTFVKFVTMCLAGELLNDTAINVTCLTAPLPDKKGKDEEQPQPWDHGALLPVLVILRDFAAKGLPPSGQPATAQHLCTFLTRTLEEAALQEYANALYHHLRQYGGLVLLDGLDEVPEASQRRTQIKQAVEDFALTFSKCRILVTSRTYAYQQQEWQLHGFTEAVLAPFSPGQIVRFVVRWYAHVGTLRGMSREKIQGRAEILKRAIFASDRLLSFAVRPLLLTLMASLHAWRGGSLPEKREELYNDTVELLLDWWESEKVEPRADGSVSLVQESLTELLRVGKDCVREALNVLAFQAHHAQPDLTGTADITQKDLVDQLMRVSQSKDLRPAWLIEFLRDRAGLLVPRGVGIYAFPHRTFQEYLAACYLTGQDDYPDNLTELVRQDPNRWREVVLLAAASVANAAPMIWLLVDTLCECAPDTPDMTPEDVWGALFAGQALVETAKLQHVSKSNQRKVQRVRKWLVAILTEQQPQRTPLPAVERALAGNVLSKLGDPRPGVEVRADGLPDIEWCEAPAGEFVMGSDDYSNERPQHRVSLSGSYAISRYPVTNAQYQAFVKAGGYTEKTYWSEEGWTWKNEREVVGMEAYRDPFSRANYPIVGVSWYEATAFCQWLTSCLREKKILTDNTVVRLPTEAEWEKAARGEDGRIFPWGNDDITPEHANFYETQLGVTSAVGCFPRGVSPYGCEEMAGNVWEWCLDQCDWDKDYNIVTDTYKDGIVDPVCTAGSSRVNRGGAWRNVAGHCRSRCDPDARFRASRSAPRGTPQYVGS